MTNFSTKGGVVTRGETYAKLLHHLREAQDMAYTMKHLHSTEDSLVDKAMAGAWNMVGEALGQMCAKVTELAMRGSQ